MSEQQEIAGGAFVGDLNKQEDVREGARLMTEDGAALAVDNGFVYGVWGNGHDKRYIDNVDAAKGRDPTRPYGLSLDFAEVAGMADLGAIHPSWHRLFEHPHEFKNRAGALVFLRFPVKPEYIEEGQIPARSYSYTPGGRPIVQNWDPTGKRNIENLLAEASRIGATFLPMVTSLNPSNSPEITEPHGTEGALEFVRRHALPLLVDHTVPTDPVTGVRQYRGSFSIISVDSRGGELVRSGPLADEAVYKLFQDIGRRRLLRWRRPRVTPPALTRSDDATGAKFPTQRLSTENIPELQKLAGPELRSAILKHIRWS